jgi:hypothetical protein
MYYLLFTKGKSEWTHKSVSQSASEIYIYYLRKSMISLRFIFMNPYRLNKNTNLYNIYS